jgi:hypothetical protein
MKAVIRVGYKAYIVPAKVGVKILTLLEAAERWEDKYHSSTDQEPAHHTYHVFYDEEKRVPTSSGLELVTDELYQMARLAGKPQK